MPTLQLLSGPRAGERLPVLGDRFVLGRAAECDAIINDALAGIQPLRADSVSRRHARLVLTGGLWYIEDGNGHGRASRNGTYVNDQRVPVPGRVRLRDQDRVRICDVRFTFHLDPESTFAVEASVGHADSGPCLDAQPADRLRVLLAISAALRGTLDIAAVLDRTLEHLFLMFPQAERGLVVFQEDAAGPPVVRALRTPRGDPADPRFSTSVVRRCLESVEAVLGNDLPAQFPDSASVGGLLVRSLMCAPLWTSEGRALGAIQLDTRADGRKFTPEDLHLLLGVASQASIALSNARLHRESLIVQRRTRDLEVAQQVQRALLPHALPDVPGYRFFAHYQAAQEVGGDYYDFVPLPGGRTAVLLGDVAGHGVAAALVMAKFGVEARVCLEAEPDPAVAVTRLNVQMMRAAMPEKFVTLALAVLDPVAHEVAVVNAGHPSPLLLRACGAVEEVAPAEYAGLPIGIAAGDPYPCRSVRLEPGDRLLLFSDGVSDALGGNEQFFGADGIRAAIGAAGSCPRATGEHLVRAVARHAAGCDPNDDITVVCFGRTAD